MIRILTILLVLMLALPSGAQQKRNVAKKKAATARTAGKKKKTAAKGKKTAAYTNASIRGLENRRDQVRKKIKEQERLLRANKADVKKRLGNLMVLNSEIDRHRKSIDGIRKDIQGIEGDIDLLKAQLGTLEKQLSDRKAKYIKSMRYMARNRNVQERLMFIFSAGNLAQMYRRMRFVREYASYQRAQGEMVREKQRQISSKHRELEKVRGQKNTLLYKGQQEQAALQGKQEEQKKVVNSLQKQQKTIQGVITEQRRQDAALNAQIDRLVAEEVAKARARAAAEAKRKAAAEAKRKAEELARKKAAAEAAARENERRIAAAREREARAREREREAARKSAEEKERAMREARAAKAEREAVERKARVENERNKEAVARAREESRNVASYSSVDRKLSSNFESNRGRLPMPITGSYRIVSHFGQYNVEGLKGVTLDNKGINILGGSGARARSIFDGEVSAVVSFGGSMVVMVRHGSYISVYCNLRSVCVSRGQKVSTRQALGTVGADNILQFQLRRETAKLNPEVWLGR